MVEGVGAEAGTISLSDSLGAQPGRTILSIRQWLNDEADDKKNPQREWVIQYPACRQQESTDDCGVFTLMNMDFIARPLDHSTMTKSTAYYRYSIAADILVGHVGGQG